MDTFHNINYLQIRFNSNHYELSSRIKNYMNGRMMERMKIGGVTCSTPFWIVSSILFVWVMTASCNNTQQKEQNLNQIESKHALINRLSEQIERNPDNPTLYFKRANALEAVRKTNLAIKDVQKALQLDSTNVRYHKKLGKLYVDQDKLKLALQTYKLAKQLAPKDVSVLLSIAKIHHYLKQYQKVFDYTNEVLRQDVHNAQAYFLKGVVYKEIGDTTKALSNFQTATEQEPEYFDAYMQLGLLNSALENPIAIEYFNNALAVDSGNVNPYYGKAMFFQKQGEKDKAKQLYRKIIEINSDYEQAFYNLGSLYFKEDSIQKAYRHFNMAIQVAPYYTKAFYMRGLCAERLGKISEARRNYKQTLKLNDNFTLAAEGLERINARN